MATKNTFILTACIALAHSTGCSEPEGTEVMDVMAIEAVTSDPLGSLLVIGSGGATPALPIAVLDSGAEVTLTIVPHQPGEIAFYDHGLEVALESQDGYIVMPPIIAGDGADGATLEIRHQDTLLGSLVIHVVSSEDLQSATQLLDHHAGAVVAVGDGYVFVDEQAINIDATGVSPIVQAMTEVTSRGLCIETPFGAGQVHWLMANPKSYGYSIDDEDAPSSLRWASGGTEDVDAVYRTSWGCSKALKIPDSCTANVGPSTVECCCNGLFYLLGYQCRYINPTQDPYFTNCPL